MPSYPMPALRNTTKASAMPKKHPQKTFKNLLKNTEAKRIPQEPLPQDPFHKKPAWRVQSLDENSAFGWDKIGQERWRRSVLPKLRHLETMTWYEILRAAGGRSSGTNSHLLPLSDFPKAFQERLEAMGLSGIDEIMSLRLQGKHRLYGWMSENIMNIIWFDFDHALIDANKKHT
jgi:hypothetical protein